MFTLKLLFLAIIFVGTSGAVFSTYFKDHKILSFMAAIVAIISSSSLFESIYKDLQNDNLENRLILEDKIVKLENKFSNNNSKQIVSEMIQDNEFPPLKGSNVNLENTRVEAPELYSKIEYVVKNLHKAKFLPVRVGWDHDYGLQNAPGLLNTFEYLRSLVTFESLQNIIPMAVFSEGPHTKDKLVLTSRYTFGHYNPEFVKYFGKVVSQLLSDRILISTTKKLVSDYGLMSNLEGLQKIYSIIDSDRVTFNKYKLQYKKMILNRTWPEDGYRTHLPSNLRGGEYWNWAESDYYFWIRRDIDGTMHIWISIINSIIDAYKKGA